MAARINIVEDYKKISEYLLDKSDTMSKYLFDNPNDQYILLLKSISHSDLTSTGKRTKIEQPFSKNYLYYLTADEMEEIDRINPRPFATAHQSNIGIPKKIVYDFLQVENSKSIGNEHLKINDYANVYLVNDTLKYFDIDYTFKVFEKLNKVPNWDRESLRITLSDEFTEISLSVAAHGIGVTADEQFHKLRSSIFKSDTLILLLSRNAVSDEKKVFIMLEKNPKFFTIIGEGNESWEKYLELHDKKLTFDLLKQDNLTSVEAEKTRVSQSKWRNLLAEEMMSYTTTDDEIFCPLTYITANYSNVGTLFRASHIKAFSECDMDEAFDINNGILMIANADALFDKHLITISDDGEIIFSFLMKSQYKLIQELKLTEKVFKAILNPKRKDYLKHHRQIFAEKEVQRKMLSNLEDDSSEFELL